MAHDSEHITDPHVYRLHASTTPRGVVLAWDYPGSTLLEVRIQRSEVQFAREPYQGSGHDKTNDGQIVVYDGDTGSFRDTTVEPGKAYYYTVWARRPPRGTAAGRVEVDAELHDVAPRHLDRGEDPGAEVGGWVLWGQQKVRAGHVPRLRRLVARLLGRL